MKNKSTLAALFLPVLISGCTQINHIDNQPPHQPTHNTEFTVNINTDESIGDIYELIGWETYTSFGYDGVKELRKYQELCSKDGRKLILYEIRDETAGNNEKWVCQSIPKLDKTEAALSNYCNFSSYSPSLSVELTDKEKEAGRQKFYKYLVNYGLTYPVGVMYQEYQRNYILWVVGKFKENPESLVGWYRNHCLAG